MHLLIICLPDQLFYGKVNMSLGFFNLGHINK